MVCLTPAVKRSRSDRKLNENGGAVYMLKLSTGKMDQREDVMSYVVQDEMERNNSRSGSESESEAAGGFGSRVGVETGAGVWCEDAGVDYGYRSSLRCATKPERGHSKLGGECMMGDSRGRGPNVTGSPQGFTVIILQSLEPIVRDS
ncbi:hypothetical protein VTL71DRAFT_1327 [Oculimacula yallundae]|uniref:Uncharacterized protein n=1 Tax=Oculimacula yallundae TaxID=86028 RepID=A0ABR4CAE7_9HELO